MRSLHPILESHADGEILDVQVIGHFTRTNQCQYINFASKWGTTNEPGA